MSGDKAANIGQQLAQAKGIYGLAWDNTEGTEKLRPQSLGASRFDIETYLKRKKSFQRMVF